MEHKKSKISNERAIENVIAQYTHFLDKGNFKAVAGMFKHGQIVVDGKPVDSEGIEKMLNFNVQLYPDGTPRTAHVTTNIVLNVDEDEQSGSAKSYLTIFQADSESAFPLQPVLIGTYDDQFTKIDGEWYFKQRILSLSLIGDLSHHARPEYSSTANLSGHE